MVVFDTCPYMQDRVNPIIICSFFFQNFSVYDSAFSHMMQDIITLYYYLLCFFFFGLFSRFFFFYIWLQLVLIIRFCVTS